MNMRTIALLAVVAAVATGAFGTDVIFAQTQTQPKRPAFYISEFELSDPEGIKPYSQQVEATFRAVHRPLCRARRTNRVPGRRSA